MLPQSLMVWCRLTMRRTMQPTEMQASVAPTEAQSNYSPSPIAEFLALQSPLAAHPTDLGAGRCGGHQVDDVRVGYWLAFATPRPGHGTGHLRLYRPAIVGTHRRVAAMAHRGWTDMGAL